MIISSFEAKYKALPALGGEGFTCIGTGSIFLLNKVGRIIDLIDDLVVFQADPGGETVFSFGHFYYAGTVGQVIVNRIASGITAVSQQDAFPVNGIVVIVVVTDKYSLNISHLFHGSKKPGVKLGSAGFFLTGSYQDRRFIGCRLVIFRQSDMEEGQ